jgi:hypothetical protein
MAAAALGERGARVDAAEALRVAQRDHRVYARRAAGGDVAGERHRILRREAEEEALDEACGACGRGRRRASS